MDINYKSGSVAVTTGTTIKPVDFTINHFEVSSDEDFYVRMRDNSGFGDWIFVGAGLEFYEDFSCVEIEVKAASGTATIEYYMRGAK